MPTVHNRIFSPFQLYICICTSSRQVHNFRSPVSNGSRPGSSPEIWEPLFCNINPLEIILDLILMAFKRVENGFTIWSGKPVIWVWSLSSGNIVRETKFTIPHRLWDFLKKNIFIVSILLNDCCVFILFYYFCMYCVCHSALCL